MDGVQTSRCSRTGDARAYPVWIVRAGEGAQKILTPLLAELEKPPDGDSEHAEEVFVITGWKAGKSRPFQGFPSWLQRIFSTPRRSSNQRLIRTICLAFRSARFCAFF